MIDSGAPQPADAGTTEECALAELTSDMAGTAGEWKLAVYSNKIVNYSYPNQGKTIHAQKLQLVLVSTDARSYCLGIARMQKGNKEELAKFGTKFGTGTAWKFSKVHLERNERPCYISTSVTAAIDLRKTIATALLNGTVSFPRMPEPTQTVASVKKLRSAKRFDIIGVPLTMEKFRTTNQGAHVYDVRITDGSKDGDSQEFATIVFAIWFPSRHSAEEFQSWV